MQFVYTVHSPSLTLSVHARARGLQQSVCLSVSLIQDDDVFMFETGINVNKATIEVRFKKVALSQKKK